MATSKITPAPLTRNLADIAVEIAADWPRATQAGVPSAFGNVGEHPAHPYLDAMSRLHTGLDGRIGWDDGASIVLHFLSNAQAWKGDTARRIKAELNAALAHHKQNRSR